MIEYIIRDDEKEIHGTAEAVCLMTAGEPVEGEEDATAAGCIYYGPSRALDMAEAFLLAAMEREADVLRHIYTHISTKAQLDHDFCTKIIKLTLADMKTMVDKLTSDGGEKAATDPATDPAFVKLMKSAGMWDDEEEEK